MIEEIYKENIIEHYKEPRNFGKIEDASHHAREVNPLCGDVIEMFLKVEDGIVKDVKFDGGGCAISQASCSMLTERIKGKSLEEIKKISKEDILKDLGITISYVRMKCALLSLDVLRNAVNQNNM